MAAEPLADPGGAARPRGGDPAVTSLLPPPLVPPPPLGDEEKRSNAPTSTTAAFSIPPPLLVDVRAASTSSTRSTTTSPRTVVPPPLVAATLAALPVPAAPPLPPMSPAMAAVPSGPLRPALVCASHQIQREAQEAAAAAADQLLYAAQRANGDGIIVDDSTNPTPTPNPTPAADPRLNCAAGDVVAPLPTTAALATAAALTGGKDPPHATAGGRAASPAPSSPASSSAGGRKKSKKKKKNKNALSSSSSSSSASDDNNGTSSSSSSVSSPRALPSSPKGKGPRRHSAAGDDAACDLAAVGLQPSAAASVPGVAAGGQENDKHSNPLSRAVRYAGVFLTPESRELLLACLPACHAANVRADHVTLAYRPRSKELAALLPSMGRTVEVRVTGEARSSRLQAAAVELDPRAGLPPTTSSAALHCTLSFAQGASAAEAGPMLHDAFLAAYDDVARARGQDASLSYVALEEPLVLFGRVGVELEAFASSFPASLATAGGASSPSASASLSSSSLGRKGDVIFSVEELVRASLATQQQQPQNLSMNGKTTSAAAGPSTSMASYYLNGQAQHHVNGTGAGFDDDDDEDGGTGLSLVSSRAPAPAPVQTAPLVIPTNKTTIEAGPSPDAEPSADAPVSPTTLLKRRYASLERAHGALVCRAVLQACKGNLRETVAELEAAALSSSPPKEDHQEAADAALAREVARQLDLQERGEREAQEAADAAHAAALAAEVASPTHVAPAAPPAQIPPPPAAAAAAPADNNVNVRKKAEVVRALAVAAGADAAAAVALLDLDPLAAPAAVVSALVECNGQADAAADALLSARPARYTTEQLMAMTMRGSGGGPGGGPGSGGGSAAAPVAAAPSSYAAAAVPHSAAALLRTLAAGHPGVPEPMLANALEASGNDLSVAARLLQEHEAAGGWQQVVRSSSSPSPRHRRASSPAALAPLAAAASAGATAFPPLGAGQQGHGRPYHSGGSASSGGGGGSDGPLARSSPRSLPPPHGSPTSRAQQIPPLLQQHRPGSSSSSSSSLSGGGGGGGGNGGGLGRSPPTSRSPPRRGHHNRHLDAQARANAAEIDRLYKEADLLQLEASVLERAAQQAATKQDAARHLAARRATLERMAALRREAGRRAADTHNAGKVNLMEVDVHGQSAADALARVRGMLSNAQGMADLSRADSRLTVIFGKGLHSGADGPVLRPAVLDLLARGGCEYEVPANNSGMVVVTVRPNAGAGSSTSPLL